MGETAARIQGYCARHKDCEVETVWDGRIGSKMLGKQRGFSTMNGFS